MLLGYDHGMGVTFDGGRNWLHPDNLPTAQFYAIAYDNDYPYNVYGGLQDNGSKKGPSTRRSGGIPFEAWYNTGGGDGMYNVVDWKDSRWLYNESQFGALQRTDQLTGENKSIRYARPQGAAGGRTLRWNWAAPILVSPHNSDVIYHAANVLLKSNFRGEMWQEISPDLTVNNPARAERHGQHSVRDHQHDRRITDRRRPAVGRHRRRQRAGDAERRQDLDERARQDQHPGRLLGEPRRGVAHDAGTAYVSVTGLPQRRLQAVRVEDDRLRRRRGRRSPATCRWKPINVIREDHKNPNLLFVGTDLGLYASIDGGKAWTKMKNGLPTNPVHDLQIHPRENELIVATHGRGIYIADITPLQGLTPQAMAADAALMDIQPVVQWGGGQTPLTASNNYAGQSRPAGVAINYYLKNAVTGGVNVRVFDGARMIAEVTGPGNAGVQTVRWNMQERTRSVRRRTVRARRWSRRPRGWWRWWWPGRWSWRPRRWWRWRSVPDRGRGQCGTDDCPAWLVSRRAQSRR